MIPNILTQGGGPVVDLRLGPLLVSPLEWGRSGCSSIRVFSVAGGRRSRKRSLRYKVSLSNQNVSIPSVRYTARDAEAVERHNRGAPSRSARGDSGHHSGPGGQARTSGGDD